METLILTAICYGAGILVCRVRNTGRERREGMASWRPQFGTDDLAEWRRELGPTVGSANG